MYCLGKCRQTKESLRTSLENEAEWDALKRHVQDHMLKEMSKYDGHSTVNLFHITIMDDSESATTSDARGKSVGA